MVATPDVIAQWEAYAAVGDNFEPPEPSAECLDFLAGLTMGGRALDLGAGTGRVAVQLARRGVSVTALDISSKAVEIISQKADGLPVDAIVGDMSDFALKEKHGVAYSTYSTLFALLTQKEQAACFRCVSESLAPEGSFVVDVFSPLNDAGVRALNHTSVRSIGNGHVDVTYMRHNPVTQRMRFQEVRVTGQGNRLVPVDIRYAWPSELDLMATLSGLRLSARYADWGKQPYNATSFRNISVYTAAAAHQ